MSGRIRKVRLDAAAAGESTDYWESEWGSVDRAASVRSQIDRPDATMRLLQRFVPATGVILEAGSGASTYLAALAGPGRTLLGVDLAGRALRTSAPVWPELGLVEGDVTAMPLRDGSVDCVISLGVVEHLEGGPGPALAEHRRVLRRGGVGLIAVPTVSGVRWVKDRWNIDIMRRDSYISRRRIVTTVPATTVESAPGRFHQYEFGASTWHRFLVDAGFEVVGGHRYLVSAGIGEISLPGRSRAPSGRAEPGLVGTPGAATTPAGSAPARRGDGIRRVVLSELPETRLESVACALSQHLFGHMILTVVRPR